MSDESIWRAVHRLEAAAQQASNAASMEETKRQLEFLFTNKYNDNTLKLIKLLKNHQNEQNTINESKEQITDLQNQLYDLL